MNKREMFSAKREKAMQKAKRQEKFMIILGCVMAALVLIFGIYAITSGVIASRNRKLTDAQMHELFENTFTPPKKDAVVGEWYYYVDKDVVSKYVLTSDGMMYVYNRNGNDFDLFQSAPYRVKEDLDTIYVLPQGSKNVIAYKYTIELTTDEDSSFYTMGWKNNDREWYMIKLNK